LRIFAPPFPTPPGWLRLPSFSLEHLLSGVRLDGLFHIRLTPSPTFFQRHASILPGSSSIFSTGFGFWSFVVSRHNFGCQPCLDPNRPPTPRTSSPPGDFLVAANKIFPLPTCYWVPIWRWIALSFWSFDWSSPVKPPSIFPATSFFFR